MVDIIIYNVQGFLGWIWNIFTGAIGLLQTPIQWLTAAGILFGLVILIRHLLTSAIFGAMQPLCLIPGAQLLSLPFCAPGTSVKYDPPAPVEFDQLISVQSKFEDVLVESAGGYSLPLEMKRGEASIRDLRQLVKYSQLQSR